MEYTKGEWKAKFEECAGYDAMTDGYMVRTGDEGQIIVVVDLGDYDNDNEAKANAHLIASAPLGYELAELIVKLSATWIDDGILEIGEATYIEIKKLAFRLKDKAEGK